MRDEIAGKVYAVDSNGRPTGPVIDARRTAMWASEANVPPIKQTRLSQDLDPLWLVMGSLVLCCMSVGVWKIWRRHMRGTR
jgi:hypothetical protein